MRNDDSSAGLGKEVLPGCLQEPGLLGEGKQGGCVRSRRAHLDFWVYLTPRKPEGDLLGEVWDALGSPRKKEVGKYKYSPIAGTLVDWHIISGPC